MMAEALRRRRGPFIHAAPRYLQAGCVFLVAQSARITSRQLAGYRVYKSAWLADMQVLVQDGRLAMHSHWRMSLGQ
jgi:hypothetical protein